MKSRPETIARVSQLLRTISEATSILSYHVSDQPQFLELVSIGNEAVPILLEHLIEASTADEVGYVGYDFHDYAPWYAIMALHKITGVNPISSTHRGRFIESVDDWLNWGKKIKWKISFNKN